MNKVGDILFVSDEDFSKHAKKRAIGALAGRVEAVYDARVVIGIFTAPEPVKNGIRIEVMKNGNGPMGSFVVGGKLQQ